MRGVVLFTTFILLSAFPLVAQPGKENKPVLAYELIDQLCSESIKAYVDGFIVKLNENPSARAFIIGSADKNIPGRYSHYGPSMHKAFEFRRVPSERLTFIQSKDDDRMVFQFWIVPAGVTPPSVEMFGGPRRFAEATLWDKSWINASTRRRVDFGGEDEPCDFGLDIKGFGEQFAGNDLVGYLVGFSDSEFSKTRTLAATELTRRQLARKFGVPSNQLRVLYGGRAKERQVQLWIVPKGKPFPLSAALDATTLR